MHKLVSISLATVALISATFAQNPPHPMAHPHPMVHPGHMVHADPMPNHAPAQHMPMHRMPMRHMPMHIGPVVHAPLHHGMSKPLAHHTVKRHHRRRRKHPVATMLHAKVTHPMLVQPSMRHVMPRGKARMSPSEMNNGKMP